MAPGRSRGQRQCIIAARIHNASAIDSDEPGTIVAVCRGRAAPILAGLAKR
jgi:hypothetical protein